jgi:hypothetical protein
MKNRRQVTIAVAITVAVVIAAAWAVVVVIVMKSTGSSSSSKNSHIKPPVPWKTLGNRQNFVPAQTCSSGQQPSGTYYYGACSGGLPSGRIDGSECHYKTQTDAQNECMADAKCAGYVGLEQKNGPVYWSLVDTEHPAVCNNISPGVKSKLFLKKQGLPMP